jgi:hypothetical protein
VNFINKTVSLALSCLFLANTAWASDEDELLKPGDYAVGAILTTTYQVDNQPLDDTEYLYSLDLDLTLQFDGWGAYGWVEYAKTTDANSVSNRFENTNADAGTAVHNQGGGRAQLSEFYLYGNTDSEGNHGWKLGLTEVTTLVDTSALANDEVSQFLSLELVNNMTISFPDYALAAMVQELSWNGLEDFGYRLVVSSSHGVQDSAEPSDEIQSYPELFDVTAHDKGVFGAGELLFTTKAYEANVGYWNNSGSNASANWGLYSGVDYFADVGSFNLRYGWASADDDEAEQFYSIAYQRDIAGGTLAGGFTLTRFNKADDSLVRHLEVYYRKELLNNVFITPMVQWASGMKLGDGDEIYDFVETNYWLFGLRLEFWM